MNSSTRQDSAPAQPMIFWILWFAILSGLLVIQVALGGGIPSGPDAAKPEMIHRVVPVALATGALAIRFFIIPRFKELKEKLPVMIVGLALAEAAGIYGMFVIDPAAGSTRLTVFLVSVACILASAPIYATAGLRGSGFR